MKVRIVALAAFLVWSAGQAHAVTTLTCGNWYSAGDAASITDTATPDGCEYGLTFTPPLDPGAPVDLEFVPTPGTVYTFDSSGGTVHNLTSMNWLDYHFVLGTGFQTDFAPLAAGTAAFLPGPFSSPLSLTMQTPTSLTFANAIVPMGGLALFTVEIAVPQTYTGTLTIRQFHSVDSVVVPEPGTALLLALGLGWSARRRLASR